MLCVNTTKLIVERVPTIVVNERKSVVMQSKGLLCVYYTLCYRSITFFFLLSPRGVNLWGFGLDDISPKERVIETVCLIVRDKERMEKCSCTNEL